MSSGAYCCEMVSQNENPICISLEKLQLTKGGARLGNGELATQGIKAVFVM